MACGSTGRNGCATKTKSDSQWHRQSCLCAFVLLQGYRFLGEQLTIAELSSVLSHGLWQHSQEWLCHKDQIRQPVAQAILPVRLCLASGLSISRGTAYNCRAFLRAESWLVAAQPGMAVPQRPNRRVDVKAHRRADCDCSKQIIRFL